MAPRRICRSFARDEFGREREIGETLVVGRVSRSLDDFLPMVLGCVPIDCSDRHRCHEFGDRVHVVAVVAQS